MWQESLLLFANWITCAGKVSHVWCCVSVIWVNELRRWWVMALTFDLDYSLFMGRPALTGNRRCLEAGLAAIG